MEEPGEQYTVVFALIVTEPASECVPVTTHAKMTVLSSPDSSMLIEAHKYAASARCKYKMYPVLPCETGPPLQAFIFYLKYSGHSKKFWNAKINICTLHGGHLQICFSHGPI
jgi:hypothetical protein